MSKRFTETQKWSDPWFRGLAPNHKVLWQWLLDHCDCAGVLPEIDWALASFQIGANVTEADLRAFEGRVEKCGKGFWISKFIAFQIGFIDQNNPTMPQRGVLKALDKAGIPFEKAIERVSKPFPKSFKTLKDKDKDKDKDLDLSLSLDARQNEAEGKPDDTQWLTILANDSAFIGIDVHREFGKMTAWCSVNRKQPTRRRFINWLNRCERPMHAKPQQAELGSVRSKAW